MRPQSTYINYKLNDFQYNKIKKFINTNNNYLKITPIQLDDEKKKFITNILDLTLVADHTASHFLHIYQDFVHHII